MGEVAAAVEELEETGGEDGALGEDSPDTGGADISMRDALEAAFDADSTPETDEKPDTGEPEHGAQTELSDKTQEAKSTERSAGEDPKSGQEAAAERPRAPNSWKAEVRENWAALPPTVQDEIIRREREHDTLMQENATNRNTAKEYESVVAPFMNNIRAEGVSPAVAVTNLLQTAASLQGGSALVKAQTITRLIGAYGVDIQTLSDVLTDKYQPTEEDKIATEVQKRMQPYQQHLNQQNQYTQNQEVQYTNNIKAETDVWAEGAEFVNDVGGLMADLLEGASRRGATLTLDDAYGQACKIHPDISKIITQREAATAAKANAKNNRGKRIAGTSVTGAGVGASSAAVPNTIRGALEAAWDDSSNDR